MPYQANRRKNSKIVGKKKIWQKENSKWAKNQGAPISLMCEEQTLPGLKIV